MAKVLVLGGAGYVGSAACALLVDRGHRVWVLDDLSTGHSELLLGEGFTRAQVGDAAALTALLKEQRFDCVMHFAARSIVPESFQKRELYWENNVEQTKRLVECLLRVGPRRIIFSSTAAVYGTGAPDLIPEDAPKAPDSPYGETKLAAEKLLQEAATRGLQSIALRYFNAAGAEPGLRVGEWHSPETHLIPRLVAAGLEGRAAQVFGRDYPTPDGTCVRDYIHVSDLAEAHLAAMERLMSSSREFEALNLGSGTGYSVLQVIDSCGKALGHPLQMEEAPRRSGDPPRLVADVSAARTALGFKARRGMDEIVASALAWERKRREAFL
ncbi:MAG: UDP-glucose 4-epimerase GalE [Bdellovibrionales bacterium]|nr:UDP-glucose 4-epimerase GalE [Bdellovibrionales bacterium]